MDHTLAAYYLIGNLLICTVVEFLGECSYRKVEECVKLGCEHFFVIKMVGDRAAATEEMQAMKIMEHLGPVKNN